MSHRDDCPSREYARERGRDEWRSGWYSPYAMGDCREAQESYNEGMAEERRREQRRREARAEQEAAEIDAAYNAQMEAEYANQMRDEEEAHWAELQAIDQAKESGT